MCRSVVHELLTFVLFRPYIHPNDGFMLQLAQFEVEKLGQSSVVKNAGSDWDFFEWNRLLLINHLKIVHCTNDICCVL